MAHSLTLSKFIKFWWKLTKLQEFIIKGNIIMILHKNNNNKCKPPLAIRHGESCDYMLSSFKQRNKNVIQKYISW